MYPSITIGIPAHNEARNIALLLRSVRMQTGNFRLERIIVACDSCTDRTAEIASADATTDPRITVIGDDRRLGKSGRLNQIFELNHSDYLVCFDGDALPADSHVVAHLLDKFTPGIAVVSANIQPVPAHNAVSLAYNGSYWLWYEIRRNYRRGDNPHNLAGAATALRRDLAERMRFPATNISDVGYMYVYLKRHELGFAFAESAVVRFHPVDTWADFRKQTQRNFNEKYLLVNDFGPEVMTEIEQYFPVPLIRKLLGIGRALLKHPLGTLLGVGANIALRLLPRAFEAPESTGYYDPVDSTKREIRLQGGTSRFKELLCLICNRLESLLPAQRPKLYILAYHTVSSDGTEVDITASVFTAQLTYLADHFDIVDLATAVDYARGDNALSRPTVALTFDDGYADMLDPILPLLSSRGFPATVFVLSDPENADREELENQKPLLDRAGINQLRAHGWSIGCHTATHADLTAPSADIQGEIGIAGKQLAGITGVPAEFFAYPKGHYNKSSVATVAAAGYVAAFTTETRPLRPGDDLYRLPRIGIDRTHSPEQFKAFFTRWGRLYLMLKRLLFRSPA